MARTETGAALTERHRLGQVKLRALALRQYMILWPLWRGDAKSFQTLIEATVPLVRVHHSLSSSLSAAYYERFRAAEGVSGTPSARLADPVDVGKLGGTLFVTGQRMTGQALAAGQSPETAMETALVRTSGTVTRLALAGGRDTILRSVEADKEAQGWARVTDSQPCAFCAMLASRGPVYKGDTVGFRAHDHCTCTSEPVYRGSEWPGRAREFKALYEEHAAGTENPVNELRRVLEGRA